MLQIRRRYIATHMVRTRFTLILVYQEGIIPYKELYHITLKFIFNMVKKIDA